MDIGLQREYGEAFRRLAAFNELLREAAAIGAGRARSLTTG